LLNREVNAALANPKIKGYDMVLMSTPMRRIGSDCCACAGGIDQDQNRMTL
jgi:hypothetical protein